ncbi:tsunagi [Carabus blaptoides fortunei]
MSDIDEIMDFEYQSDEDEDGACLKLSKQCKRKHCENSEYPKKQRTTSATDDDNSEQQQVVFPPVENEIETTDNQRTKTEENHSSPNLYENREENGKKTEEIDQKDESADTQVDLKGTMEYPRNMHKNKRVPVDVPEMSRNGWVLFVNSLHEEVTEVEVRNLFAEYGEICDIRLNMCRRTGFVAGYALIQYNTYADALKAKEALHNTEFLGRKISVDWCFLQSPKV